MLLLTRAMISSTTVSSGVLCATTKGAARTTVNSRADSLFIKYLVGWNETRIPVQHSQSGFSVSLILPLLTVVLRGKSLEFPIFARKLNPDEYPLKPPSE